MMITDDDDYIHLPYLTLPGRACSAKIIYIY